MIIAIIVAFNPEAEGFIALLRELETQVDGLVVVDNSPRASSAAWDFFIQSQVDVERSCFVRLGENAGVGTALNVGAEVAFKQGADFLLLSDQDSLPDTQMVAELVALFNERSGSGAKVAAVGPTYTDLNTNRPAPFQTQEPGKLLYSLKFPERDGYIDTLGLITSGSLIPRSVFEDVGPMKEDFFIDLVDVEWCLRAMASGYKLYGSGAARMFQRIGDESLRVWYLGWQYRNQHPPFRIYYRVRNHTYLMKAGYGSFWWKLRSTWYTVGLVYSHSLFGDRRRESFKMTVKGVRDALSNRFGSLES